MPRELTKLEQIYYEAIIKIVNIWIEYEGPREAVIEFIDKLVDELLKGTEENG